MKWFRWPTRSGGTRQRGDAEGACRGEGVNDTDSWLVAWGCDAAVVYRVPATHDEPGRVVANGIELPDLTTAPRTPRRGAPDQRPGVRRPKR